MSKTNENFVNEATKTAESIQHDDLNTVEGGCGISILPQPVLSALPADLSRIRDCGTKGGPELHILPVKAVVFDEPVRVVPPLGGPGIAG